MIERDSLAALQAQNEHLQAALANRDVIGQGKGILMERHKITADEAFQMLVTASQALNVKVSEIAGELARTGALPDPATNQADGCSTRDLRVAELLSHRLRSPTRVELTIDELQEALAVAIGEYDDALRRNRDADLAGRPWPIGRGALKMLNHRVVKAEAALLDATDGERAHTGA